MRRNIASSFARSLCWVGIIGIGVGVWLLNAAAPASLSVRLLQLLAFSLLTLVTWVAYPEAGLLRVGERLALFRAGLELSQSLPIMPGNSDMLDWCIDCSAIGAVLSVIWLARKMWLGFIEIDEERAVPRKAVWTLDCEIIDMKEWKARAAARTSPATMAGQRL